MLMPLFAMMINSNVGGVQDWRIKMFCVCALKYADEAQKAVEKLDGKIFIKIFFFSR